MLMCGRVYTVHARVDHVRCSVAVLWFGLGCVGVCCGVGGRYMTTGGGRFTILRTPSRER